MVSVTLDSSSAVNEINWNPSGTQIAAGDEGGRIHIYDVGEVGNIYASNKRLAICLCMPAG